MRCAAGLGPADPTALRDETGAIRYGVIRHRRGGGKSLTLDFRPSGSHRCGDVAVRIFLHGFHYRLHDLLCLALVEGGYRLLSSSWGHEFEWAVGLFSTGMGPHSAAMATTIDITGAGTLFLVLVLLDHSGKE